MTLFFESNFVDGIVKIDPVADPYLKRFKKLERGYTREKLKEIEGVNMNCSPELTGCEELPKGGRKQEKKKTRKKVTVILIHRTGELDD